MKSYIWDLILVFAIQNGQALKIRFLPIHLITYIYTDADIFRDGILLQ